MSASSRHGVPEISPESLSASGRTSEKLSLPTLQSKMKCDPEGYETELTLVYSQFKSSLELFQQQAALNFTSISGIGSDPTVAKDLGDRAMFLAHVTPFYPKHLSQFPKQLADFLRSAAFSLPSGLRCHIVQALILLMNRKIFDIRETLALFMELQALGDKALRNLALFMELQALGDKALRNLAFSHVIHSIRRMNQKHKNEAHNRALQNILFPMLQQEDEGKAKRALITLCDLHRRRVWFDDRTANAICTACFHTSSRIMIAALSFLLDYEKIEDGDESDGSSSEDDTPAHQPQAVISREAMYKAYKQGTVSSKKKKKAKLQRAIRSMKKHQRMSSENKDSNYYSPLNHLKDSQGFAEKLFSRLQTCNERFEIKMMMLKVIARTVGLHRLILLNFYPFLQKYVQPHQRDVTNLLAAAAQSCHDMVPPDAVEPLFRQIVNQFVHDKSRTEAIAVGLNVVREICMRMPLLMTEDLLQDLVLYKKSNEKAVSSAARSLVTLFREVCPSLLIKKDRGRPINPKARPKAFGEVNVVSDVPDAELLEHDDENEDAVDDDEYGSSGSSSDDKRDEEVESVDDEDGSDSDNANEYGSGGSSDDDLASQEGADILTKDLGLVTESEDDETQEDYEMAEDDDNSTGSEAVDSDCDDEGEEGKQEEFNVGKRETKGQKRKLSDFDGELDTADTSFRALKRLASAKMGDASPDFGERETKGQKRKFSDFDGELDTADTSLRALKRLASAKMGDASPDTTDGILSNDDFQRIKELKAKKEARIALSKHGLLKKASDAKSTTFKLPSSEQLSAKRVDPAKLEVHVKKKMSKEEKRALVKAGREERGKYQAKTAVKQKKTGGLSNRQKEHKKSMPIAAKRAKVAKSRQAKKKKQRTQGKQFRGRKAWK